MPFFCVTCHGSNFFIPNMSDGDAPIIGFYIVRYVRAKSPTDAEVITLKLIQDLPQYQHLVKSSKSNHSTMPKLIASEVKELSLFRRLIARNSGFIFYSNE